MAGVLPSSCSSYVQGDKSFTKVIDPAIEATCTMVMYKQYTQLGVMETSGLKAILIDESINNQYMVNAQI